MAADFRMNRANNGQDRGFTLIELMIAVVIVAVLASIAYPIYMSQVRQARRVDAKAALKTAINRGEQYYSQIHHYPSMLASITMNTTTDNGAYTLSVTAASTTAFTVAAKPQGDQKEDSCGTFTLKANGEATADGGADCW